MIMSGYLNLTKFKVMKTRDELIDEIMRQFHQLPSNIQKEVFQHEQHTNVEQWKEQLLNRLDDLITYYAKKNFSLTLLQRLNHPNTVILPTAIKGILENYQGR